MAGLLTRQVRQWVQAYNPKHFFDLYAGVGTFGFISAKDVPHVYCIEESVPSLEALRMNRDEKKSKSLEIIQGESEKAFPLLMQQREVTDSMVCVDPPRFGLSKNLAEFIRDSSRVGQLVYISCDLATLVRDLKIILEDGRFRVQEIVPLDMFPRTKHIEIAALIIYNSN